MTAFARSDVMSVSLPATENYQAHTHARKVTKKETKSSPAGYEPEFAVTCACETDLIEKHGWARRADAVELTPDQILEAARLEKEGTVATGHMAQALAKAAAELVATGQKP